MTAPSACHESSPLSFAHCLFKETTLVSVCRLVSCVPQCCNSYRVLCKLLL